MPMTLASTIKFPFERGIEYPIAELRAFEAELLKARQANSDLSNELRAPEKGSPRWIKLRNEELVPLEYYARHKSVSEAANFTIMPEGCKTDLRLSNSGRTENLQITIADPIWAFPDPDSVQHGGHYHRLTMEILNQSGSAGSGPIIRSGGTSVLDRQAVLSSKVLDACRAGLVETLSKKFQKIYEDREYILLVHARAFCENLSLDRFINVAHSAINEVKAKVSNSYMFKSVYIFDSGECYFVDVSN